MAVNLSPVGGVAALFFDNSGNVLTGGKLNTYLAGTTTPVVAYTTSAGNVPWSNPIVLNAAGRVSGSGEIWLTSGITYKFVLTDSNDVLIATYDNITGINDVSFTNIVNFTGNGVQVSFTLPEAPISENFINVFINGVYQFKNTFSITSGTTLLFSEAPPVTSKIEVEY
jgi:hypothetical protein